MAYIRAKYDKVEECYIEPEDDIFEKRLFELVKRKQLHTCKVDKCLKGSKKNANMDFLLRLILIQRPR